MFFINATTSTSAPYTLAPHSAIPASPPLFNIHISLPM